MPHQVVLFCCSGLEPAEVDPDFQAERASAVATGFQSALVDHDAISTGNAARGVARVGRHGPGTPAVYRGWMLRVEEYEALYRALEARGLDLINTPQAYRTCHWLPASYDLIADWTPASTWIPASELVRNRSVDWDRVLSAAAGFGAGGLVIKDYVKSQKHYWLDACYIPRANDADTVRRVVTRFLELQGEDLAGGLVIRRHLELRQIGKHAQSGMPLSEEYRLFFLDGRVLIAAPYWDQSEARLEELPIRELIGVAEKIPSRFFSMDVARGTDGRWWIIELGDGQVAGLPPRVDAAAFYRALRSSWHRGVLP